MILKIMRRALLRCAAAPSAHGVHEFFVDFHEFFVDFHEFFVDPHDLRWPLVTRDRLLGFHLRPIGCGARNEPPAPYTEPIRKKEREEDL